MRGHSNIVPRTLLHCWLYVDELYPSPTPPETSSLVTLPTCSTEDGSIVAVGSDGDWEKDSVGCVDFSDVLFADVPRGRRFRAGEVSFVHSVAAPSELLPFAPLMM